MIAQCWVVPALQTKVSGGHYDQPFKTFEFARDKVLINSVTYYYIFTCRAFLLTASHSSFSHSNSNFNCNFDSCARCHLCWSGRYFFIPGTVFTTGDNAYDSGTLTQFSNCYDPTWGRHKDRTKPIPGNHEYHTSGAAGYFKYFNNIPPYYAYNLGSWRIYALNSEIDVSANSAEVAWLQSDLAANPSNCVLAYWHQPRWSSGTHHGSNADYQTLWKILYEAGAELVLNGHEHNYERFAPMNAAGEADPAGLREIVVGTGGRNHYEFGTILPTSEVHDSSTFGVLKLTLRATGYDWEFVPVAGSTFTDSGSTDCH